MKKSSQYTLASIGGIVALAYVANLRRENRLLRGNLDKLNHKMDIITDELEAIAILVEVGNRKLIENPINKQRPNNKIGYIPLTKIKG